MCCTRLLLPIFEFTLALMLFFLTLPLTLEVGMALGGWKGRGACVAEDSGVCCRFCAAAENLS